MSYLYSQMTYSSSNFHAAFECISLISCLCDYSYTIKAWKKDVQDLFYDNDFFFMNFDALRKWTKVIDTMVCIDPCYINVLQMAVDRTAFTDFQSNSVCYPI